LLQNEDVLQDLYSSGALVGCVLCHRQVAQAEQGEGVCFAKVQIGERAGPGGNAHSLFILTLLVEVDGSLSTFLDVARSVFGHGFSLQLPGCLLPPAQRFIVPQLPVLSRFAVVWRLR
jgi:hypothetical protein